MADKNFIVKNGLEVGGQEVVSSSGVVTSAALGGQTLASTDSPTFNNLTVSNDLGVSGDLNLTGDLNITGDVNSLSVTDLDVTDQTITLGVGQVASASGGSGIVVERTDDTNPSILWDETNTEWDFNNNINVTGTVTADGLTVDGFIQFTDSGSSNRNILYLDGSDNVVLATGTTAGFRGIDLYTNNNKSLSVAENGDISFYEDTGTTAKLFWDASAESLGIGTDSPASLLEIEATEATTFDGTATDGQAANGSTLAIQNLSDTNNTFSQLLFRNRNTSKAVSRIASLTDATGTEMAFVVENNGSPAEVLRIDKTGNVGIGTTSPQYKFDVYGTDDITMRIHRPSSGLAATDTCGIGFSQRGDTTTSSSDTRAGIFSTYNGDLFLAVEAAGNLNSNPMDHSALFIEGANGNVGIGTTSPDYLLEVNGFISTDISSGNTAGVLVRKAGATKGYLGLQGGWEGNAGTDLAIAAETGGQIHLYTNGSATKRVTIDSSGNVGIGESLPENILHIKKAASGSSYSADGSDLVIIENNNSAAIDIRTPTGDSGGILFSDTTRARGAIIYYHSLDDMYFNVAGTSGAMVLDSSGNVGIGEATPDDTLHVNNSGGTARIRIGSGNDAYYTRKGYLGDEWVFGTGETNDNVDFKISGGAFTTANSGGNFRFFTQNSNATPAQRMLIASEGYLEIASFSSNSDSTDTSTHRKIEFKANGNGEQTHKRTCFVQRYVGSNQYHWYKIVLGSNSYGRGSNVKYTANWSTGHASGQGIVDGSFICRARHDNSRIDVHGHVVYSRQVVTGTYYAWSDDPDITLYESTATGSSAGIYMRVQGARTSGYDGAAVHALYLDIFGSRQDTHYQGIYHVGTSTPSDVGSAISRTILS